MISEREREFAFPAGTGPSGDRRFIVGRLAGTTEQLVYGCWRYDIWDFKAHVFDGA